MKSTESNSKETELLHIKKSLLEQKSEILDNEHNCKYQFNFQKALLNVKTQQKGCERFSGIYRLYD